MTTIEPSRCEAATPAPRTAREPPANSIARHAKAAPAIAQPSRTVPLNAYAPESQAERRVRQVAPWVGSIAVHIGLIGLGLITTWAVVRFQPKDDEPVLIVADFDAMQYQPVLEQSPAADTPSDRQARVDSVRVPLPEPRETSGLKPTGVTDVLAPASPMGTADFSPAPPQGSATFVGMRASNAQRIVYVMDASGSMIGAFPIILEELARSLDHLAPPQQFQIVFFQNNDAVSARGLRQLVPATPHEKRDTLEWISNRDHILPQGRSNPLKAIETAMSFDPDVIFLLSNNITGSGQFEIDQRDLMAMLEEMNPRNPANGRRKVQINCVQFLDPDPLDALKKIAERHGGSNGYRFLDRTTLGVEAP
jgi:hypothetical protein